MAYSAAAVSAADLALAAADKPILASIASLPGTSAFSGQWVDVITGIIGATDDTNASYPFANCIDGLTNVQTRPTTSDTAMALLFDFSAAPIEFDFVAILNHNLYSAGCTDLDIEIANNSAFSTNLIELASFNPTSILSSDRRFTRLVLQDSTSAFGVATRYTGVPYARLQFTFSGSAIPRIGEVVFGRRRQLKWQPDNPADFDALTGHVERFVSGSGIKRDTEFYTGARSLDFSWTPNSTALSDDVIAWFAATNYGSRTFAYIDSPNSAPNDIYMMVQKEPGAFSLPFVNWQARRFELHAEEQGPYFLAKDTR